mgnify:CR=1 FL=1
MPHTASRTAARLAVRSLTSAGLLLALLLGLPRVAVAQEDPVKSAPTVHAVLQSADGILVDLKTLLDLTSPTEKKQWENVEGIIETFLFGIDRTKPVGVEIILGGDEERFRFALPIDNLKTFVDENLGGFEITSRRIGNGLYRLSEQKDTLGYMRVAKGYATISEQRAEVSVAVTPQAKMPELLAKRYGLAARISNKAGGEAARRRAFQPVRRNLLAATKAKKGESADSLAFRKTFLGFELSEAERFFAESQSLTTGLKLDKQAKAAFIDIDLTALAGSSLDKSIKELGTSPSHFHSVPRSDDAILSGRLHHPLDAFRRTGLTAVLASARAAIHDEIQQKAEATDAQKAASIKLLDTVVAVTQSGLDKGYLDSFLDVRPAPTGNHVMVGAIRTVQGARLREALAAAPASTLAANVTLDTEKAGNVQIHSIAVPATYQSDFESLFGKSNTLLIGTSDDAAWCAAGPGALEALKTAIAAQATVQDAKADPVFVDLQVKLGPWLKLLDARLADAKPGTPAAESAADRKLALSAFAAGGDTLGLQLRRKGDGVVGRTTLGTGVLRFLGKVIAKFSKENFE